MTANKQAAGQEEEEEDDDDDYDDDVKWNPMEFRANSRRSECIRECKAEVGNSARDLRAAELEITTTEDYTRLACSHNCTGWCWSQVVLF